ncbi:MULTISPECIES: tetratricopeptide repeat protein [unclassified Pseudoalteromonas]|uniref:tetratricopeptide repeat protein n=1 Tax=unclassified Pseudoalteromonas TaxID=194690 RepID=UPI0005A815AA|nr:MULTISPECIES: tetratricopeptide repeat protein [unclassified Pseudoalteromonas]
MSGSFLLNKWFSIFIIASVTWLIYFNSLYVPFYLDDIRSISQNQLLINGSTFEIFNHNIMRSLGYISFAFNLNDSKDVLPFHITNVLIHMINGILVYCLTYLLIFKTSFDKKYKTINLKYLPLIVAIIFIVHPLHTQAVTYIVQRIAALVALFYFAALCSYIILRNQTELAAKAFWFIIFIVMTISALLTKQNSVTLPLVIIALELILFQKLKFKHIGIITSIVFTALILAFITNAEGFKEVYTALDNYTRETKQFSRLDYFLAQANVIWIYIAKLFVPYPIRLEYPYHVNSFELWQTVIAALGHILVFSLGFIFRKHAPLILFGICFYYLAHMVESALIPIRDITFEHRSYLPDFGLILAVFSGFLVLLIKYNSKPNHTFLAITLPIIVILSAITINRNNQWQDPILFYHNELVHSPYNTRVLNNLATAYYNNNELSKAMPLIEKSVQLSQGEMSGEMINNYLAFMIESGSYLRAEEIGLKSLPQIKDLLAKARVLNNLGILKLKQGLLPEAETYFKRSIKQPNYATKTLFSLSLTLAKQGKLKEAQQYNIKALKLDPENNDGHKLLNQINHYLQQAQRRP